MPDEEDAPLAAASRLLVAGKRKTSGSRIRPGTWKMEQPAAADDADGEKGEQDAAGQPAELLERLHAADDLLLRRRAAAPAPRAGPGTMRGICWMAPNAAA